MVNVNDLMTVSGVARELQISENTVRLLERRGQLPCMRIGNGMRLFDRELVERFARERQRDAA